MTKRQVIMAVEIRYARGLVLTIPPLEPYPGSKFIIITPKKNRTFTPTEQITRLVTYPSPFGLEVTLPDQGAVVPVVAARNDPVPGPPLVPIQDGATIDFSTGAAMVKIQGKDQEALDRALREMASATKDVTFPPTKKD